ncbi:MAG: hypothetical protein GY851_29935 [bacterium]|nr:hypothetical protein [bacterium]
MWRTVLTLTVVAVLLPGCSPDLPDNSGPPRQKDFDGLSVDDLLALHIDEDAYVDRQALEIALRAKLKDVPTPELLRLRSKAKSEDPIHGDPEFKSLMDRVTAHALFVHGTISNVECDRDDVIRDILGRYMGEVGVSTTVEVLGRYPAEPKSEVLTYKTWTLRADGMLRRVGLKYIFLFTLVDGQIPDGSAPKLYRVHDGVVERVTGRDPAPLDEMWRAVKSRHTMLAPGVPDDDTLNDWRRKLAEGDLVASAEALDLLSRRPETTPAPDALLGVLKRHYAAERRRLDEDSLYTYDRHSGTEQKPFRTLALKVVELLTESGNADAIRRMYTSYVGDLSTHAERALSYRDGFDTAMVRMVLALPDPERLECLKDLFTGSGVLSHGNRMEHYVFVRDMRDSIGLLGATLGPGIDALLLSMMEFPKGNGLRTEAELAAVWTALAARGDMEIRPMLEQVMRNPTEHEYGLRKDNSVRDRVGARRQYAMEALAVLAMRLEREEGYALALELADNGYYYAVQLVLRLAGDDLDSAKPILLQMDMSDVADHVSSGRIGDPRAASKVRAEYKANRDPRLLDALAACGDVDWAIRAAVRNLEPAKKLADKKALYDYLRRTGESARFLAYQRSQEAVGGLRKMLGPEHVAYLEEKYRVRLPKQQMLGIHPYQLSRWREWVLAALTAADPVAARPFLLQQFQSSRQDERIFAAFGLLAGDDDRGMPTLDAYVAHESTYRSFLPLALVRSPQTDELLLKRLGSGIDGWDVSNFWVHRGFPGARPAGFAREYAETILPHLLDYAQSKDPRSRYPAQRCLGSMLGSRGQKTLRFPTGEQLRQEREYWHNAAAKFLAE